MKVFITGATGYIGFNVAQKFQSAGYDVSGLTRSATKAQLLKANNIKPVIGSMQEPESYLPEVSESDVVILAAAEYGKQREGLERKTVESIIKTAMMSKQKKTLLYTSGTWVYGKVVETAATEEFPLAPLKIMEWLPCVEEIVLNSPFITGIVMRPGCVYGKQGDMTSDWFNSAITNNDIVVAGKGNNHWAWIHVDDLGQAYLLAAERSSDSTVFNVADSTHVSIGEIISKLIKVSGFTSNVNYLSEEEAQKTFGDYSEALMLDQHINSDKARELLGWQPQHESIFTSLEQVFNEWKEYNNNKQQDIK